MALRSYEVTYLRSSERWKYKHDESIPRYVVVVEAKNKQEAMMVASKPGRYVESARYLPKPLCIIPEVDWSEFWPLTGVEYADDDTAPVLALEEVPTKSEQTDGHTFIGAVEEQPVNAGSKAPSLVRSNSEALCVIPGVAPIGQKDLEPRDEHSSTRDVEEKPVEVIPEDSLTYDPGSNTLYAGPAVDLDEVFQETFPPADTILPEEVDAIVDAWAGEGVDGDLTELDPEVLAALRGENSRSSPAPTETTSTMASFRTKIQLGITLIGVGAASAYFVTTGNRSWLSILIGSVIGLIPALLMWLPLAKAPTGK